MFLGFYIIAHYYVVYVVLSTAFLHNISYKYFKQTMPVLGSMSVTLIFPYNAQNTEVDNSTLSASNYYHSYFTILVVS